MTDLQISNRAAVATPDEAARTITSLPVFRLQPPTSQEEALASERAIERLSQPAPRHWISGRVVVTLSHYFVAQQEAAIVKAVADDWADILSDYPAWAISNACKWWISRENENHHRKPVPGDIQARAHREMEAVRAAKMTLSRGVAPARPAEPERASQISEEERARRAALVAEMWGGAKKMKEGEA